MNNAIFGKTMENVRRRINVEMIQTEWRFKKVLAKPTFHRFKIFNEGLVGVQLFQADLMLNNPYRLGFLFWISVKPSCTNSTTTTSRRLLFTETDSLCYNIPTEDIYKDMEQDAHLFDTSDYPKGVNKKMLGKMKDETAGVPIEEFVGLQPKMYSLVYGGEKEKRTANGITRANQRQTKHEQYNTSLFQGKATGVIRHIIGSYDRELYSE